MCPFPDVENGKWQISNSGGLEPRWSPDGRELFFRDLSDAMMAVSIQTMPTFKADLPKTLFRGDFYTFLGHNWDISPDGKRFLMIKSRASTGAESTAEVPRKISIVLNWFEELKEQVPMD